MMRGGTISSKTSSQSPDPEETWKTWLLFAAFGLLFLTPASFAAVVLHTSGLPIGVTVLMVGLSVPSLLIPALPKKRRRKIMQGGWPARVAFGVPGLVMGILMMQFSVLDMGDTFFIVSLANMLFGGMMATFGGLLLFPNLTDTHSTD